MNKILQATSRGQVTLPKVWRDKFNTAYYVVEIKNEELVFKPLKGGDNFTNAVESSWEEYKGGDVISNEDLMKKYGL